VMAQHDLCAEVAHKAKSTLSAQRTPSMSALVKKSSF